MNDWGHLEGLIPILGGVVGLLLARGVLPRNLANREKMELWRQKYSRTMTVLCPLLILFGLAVLFGLL
jgi:hypothetical protein